MSNVITITARIIDAEKVKASIGSIGDVSTKTAKEIQAHSRAIVAAEKEIEAAFKTQAAEYRTQREALRTAQAEAAQAARSAREQAEAQKAATIGATRATHQHAEATKTLSQYASDLTGHTLQMVPAMLAMGAAMGVAMGAIQGVGAAFTFARDQAALYESAMKTLQTVTVRTGGNFTEAKGLVKEFSDAISSPAAAAQAVRIFNTMNLPMEKQRELISGIRDGLVAMGMDVNEQLPMMALAIKRQESVLLDNMGVTRTIEMMYKEFARTIGVSVEQLTQQQKEQAVVNGTLQDLQPLLGSAKDGMDTYKGSVSNLNAALLELGTTAGDKLNPHLKFLNTQMANTAREVNKLLSDPINVNFAAEPKAKGDLGLPAGFKSVYSLPGGMERLRTAKEQEEFRLKEAILAKKAQEDAKKTSEKHAEEQKRQAQQLRDELLTINKTGAELELAQEEIRHRKEMETAAGAHKNLELEQERHRRALQAINAKYPPLVMSGANASAPGLSISMGGGVKGLDLGNTGLDGWKASQGQTLGGLQQVSELGDLERFKVNLTQSVTKSFEDGAATGMERALRSLADGDLGGVADTLKSTIKDSATSGLTEAVIATFGNPAFLAPLAGAVGTAAVIGGVAAIIDWEKQREKQAKDGYMQSKAATLPTGTPAFDMTTGKFTRLGDAAETAAEAQERLAVSAEWAADRFAKVTQEVETFARARENAKEGAFGAYENYMVSTGKATRESFAQAEISGNLSRINDLSKNAGGKTISAEDLAKIDPSLFNPSDGRGKFEFIGEALGVKSIDGSSELLLLDTLQKVFSLKADQERVGPGSTPDRPLYSSIVNFKDMMAFFAPGELFRAQGPGTSRGDGMKGRAVNTRGA